MCDRTLHFLSQGSGKTLAFGIPILQHILNNSSMIDDATEHAQKHIAAKRTKAVVSKRSGDGKPLKSRLGKESGREENVVDLNVVLHQFEMSTTGVSDSDLEDVDLLKDSPKEDSLDEDELAHTLSDEMESGEHVHSASGNESDDGSVKADTLQDLPDKERSKLTSVKKAGMGLIGVRDDIPDEAFQKMIAGELDPWESHDVAATSHDVSHDVAAVSISHDNAENHNKTSDGGLQSHDIKAESHETMSHGQRRTPHESRDKLVALILAPTRELAIQVHDHLTAVAKYTKIKVHTSEHVA